MIVAALAAGWTVCAVAAPVTATPRPDARPSWHSGKDMPATVADSPRPFSRPSDGGWPLGAVPSAAASDPPAWLGFMEGPLATTVCLTQLAALGGDFSHPDPVSDPDNADCGIARPVRLHMLDGVTVEGDALMRCETARSLALWMRDFVQPAAARLPDAPQVAAITPGSTWQCRATIGDAGQDISQHAFGNAFDIAAFRLGDGARFEIRPRTDTGDLDEAFQRSVRASACLYFTTVIGPGTNAAHDDHLHLDIKPRNGGWRLCQ